MYLFCLDVHANVVIERISDLQQQRVCSKVIDKIIIKLPYLAQIRIVLSTISYFISDIDSLYYHPVFVPKCKPKNGILTTIITIVNSFKRKQRFLIQNTQNMTD